jgi:hypothetical protein
MYKIWIIILLASAYSYSAEPLIELKNYPGKGELEVIQDNEELYASKLLEYYKFASIYEAQLNSMGIKPVAIVSAPTLEDMQDAEAKILKKYYTIAKNLETQVKQSPSGPFNAKYNNLKSKFKTAENEIFMLQDSLYWMGMENNKIKFYKENFPKLLAELDSLRFRNDSLLMVYNQKLWKHDDKLRSMYLRLNYQKPLITVGATLNQFYFNNNRIETDLSGGIFVAVCPEPILGFGKYFDIWAEYQFPRWKSKNVNSNVNQGFINEYSTNIYDAGLSLSLPISKLFNVKSFLLNLRFGGGLFWGNTRLYNSFAQKADWDGYVIKTDISIVNYSHIFPVGVYVGLSFFNLNRDLVLTQYGGNLNLGKFWLDNFQIGIQFPLISNSHIMR